uniref:Uncharacterized protein n=1 Tax=Romanomermis culicivorax TaxID=13658 RepID=A0A915HK09_ROMCU
MPLCKVAIFASSDLLQKKEVKKQQEEKTIHNQFVNIFPTYNDKRHKHAELYKNYTEHHGYLK